jgi:RNA polymerase sigma-70 factor (ECF subfamily)
LYRIARNLLVDHYRKAGGRAALPLQAAEAQTAPDEDPPVLVDLKLSIERLHRALVRLDEAQREVVTLRFLSGLSLQETAAALEKTEAAIKALQHRGLAALRQALTSEQVDTC